MALDLTDKPLASRRYTPSFYFVLLLLVLPIWSTVPLAWTVVVYSLHTGKLWLYTWMGKTVFALCLCEVFFSVHYYHLARGVSDSSPVGTGKLHEIQAAYARLLKAGLANLPEDGLDEESMNSSRPGSPAEPIIQLERDDPRAIDFRHCLRTWFLHVPWSSIKLHEIRKWLYWSIFNTELPPLETLSPGHQLALDEALDLLQKRSGSIIEEGSDPSITPMRLTIDPVNTRWRPLVYYVTIGASNWWIKKWFERHYATRFGTFNGLDYIVRIPETWDACTGPRPIVFLHGLGLGLLQYNVSLRHLLQSIPDQPILIPLQPQISQDFFHPKYLKPMSRHEMADRLAALMEHLGWVDLRQENMKDTEDCDDDGIPLTGKGITIISHSNGSYTHAWMLKGYPKIVTRSCFVDPVTFCSWEGDVCYNFIYRPCRTGIELLMRYFVGTELGVANCLQRHFDWTSNSLWYEEIPHARDATKTLFVLGGKDDIIHTERVIKYLTSHGIREGLVCDPNGRHGQALITSGALFAKIIKWLKHD